MLRRLLGESEIAMLACVDRAFGGLNTHRCIKQAPVGYGKAEKKQVQTMVTLQPKEVPEPDDIDAVAAICHAHS